MIAYKITNTTDLAGKRDLQYNSTLNIEYVDYMIRKTIKIKPGETIYLKIASLPLSVHNLRVRKLISVVEISENELRNSMDNLKPAPIAVPVKEVEVTEEDKKISNEKKKIIQKPLITKVTETE